MHRRPGAQAGDAGPVRLPESLHAHRENALHRRLVVFQLDVGGGVADLAAELIAADDAAGNRIRPPEQLCRHRHVARRQRLAHGGGRGALAGGFDGMQRFGFEAMLLAELLQQREIAGAAGAETEIVADQHITRIQAANQDALHEFFRRQRGEGFAEAADMHMRDAERAQDFQLLAQRGQPRRRRIGREDFTRMRLEGQHGGQCANRGRARGQPRQHGLVTKMNAVEIADGHGVGAAGAAAAVFQAAKRAVGHQHEQGYSVNQLVLDKPAKYWKSAGLRLTRVSLRLAATAATCPSRNGALRPAAAKRARSRACQSAASWS